MNSRQNQDDKDKRDDSLIDSLSKIAAGKALVENDKAPDKKDKKADQTLDQEAKKAAVSNDWLLIGLRKIYGYNLVIFMWVYFVVTFGLISLSAFHVCGIDIPKAVLTAAIGGTAVSVLGVVGTIASGLFRPPGKD